MSVANNSIRTSNLPVKILAFMAERDYRLSAVKIADSLGEERRRVTSALQGLKDREMVNTSGLGKGMMWGLIPEDIEISLSAHFAGGTSIPQFGILIEHKQQLRAL